MKKAWLGKKDEKDDNRIDDYFIAWLKGILNQRKLPFQALSPIPKMGSIKKTCNFRDEIKQMNK